MALPRLSNLEMQIMEALWQRGPASVREIIARLPGKNRLAYTTVQTIVVRLEAKGALRRDRSVSTAHIFEPLISRKTARRRLIGDFLAVFGGSFQPIMVELVETKKLTLADVREAEDYIREWSKKKKERTVL
jgi:predicted transcriptional regulator